MKQIIKFAYFFSCFFVVMSSFSLAYIDPTAVTYVIQAVAGALIALGALLTIFRHKIVSFFKKNKKTDIADEAKIEFKEIDE